MKKSSTSRRIFLGNIALLSAGTAFGGVTTLLSGPPAAADPEKEWKRFCRQHGARPAGQLLPGEHPALVPGKGHFHETGDPVCFPAHGLLAQPTWVYWNEQKTKAADVILTFYPTADTKCFRLNRFELEALAQLNTEPDGVDLLALLHQSSQARSFPEKRKAPLAVQTKIGRGGQVQIRTRLFQKVTSTQKQLIFHV